MTEASPIVVGRGTAVATVLLVLVLGAGGTWVVMRNRSVATVHAPTAGSPGAATGPAGAVSPSSGRGYVPDIVVPLTKEALQRAGIVVAPVAARALSDDLRLPGAVEPNAYRQVSVTPLVGGRLVRVSAQLGERVRRGQSIAQVYSPELAEARTKYLAARAMLDAHDRELLRTQKLVAIGAASLQELERVHAEHSAQTAEVESARSRLQLLGAPAEGGASATGDASATIDVPSPIDGVVTERVANVGLNVDPAAKLFTIVDLSTVWLVADAYEQDLHRIRDGARATVMARAFPDRPFEGRVSYIDPQLSEATRTAKVRVEVANPRAELRLGMYADVVITAAGGRPVLAVPKGAVQNVGGRQVVYLPAPDDPTKFTEREIHAGRSEGDLIEVVSGLTAGDSIVTEGSFYVRAEAERLGLRGSGAAAPPAHGPVHAQHAAAARVQAAKVVVSDKGYEPEKVSLRRGVVARLTFVRTTEKTCGTDVVFPSLGIKRDLPLREPVTIEFTPSKTGEIGFACGMNMLSGTVVVE
jgi:RND family efflux transporter MFP subunit